MPAKFGKRIYKGIASEKKWWWHVENAPHISAFHVDQGKWRSEFLVLLDQTRPRQATIAYNKNVLVEEFQSYTKTKLFMRADFQGRKKADEPSQENYRIN